MEITFVKKKTESSVVCRSQKKIQTQIFFPFECFLSLIKRTALVLVGLINKAVILDGKKEQIQQTLTRLVLFRIIYERSGTLSSFKKFMHVSRCKNNGTYCHN